jgi:hypothetical protein
MIELIVANLLPLAVLGLILLVVSAFWDDLTHPVSGLGLRLKAMGRVRRTLLTIGLSCLACVGAGLLSVIRSTPGREETVIEVPPQAIVQESLTLAEKLHADWDSYAPAIWPVAEVMAEASRIAYLPPYKAEKEFLYLGYESVEMMSDGSMIGYVVCVGDVAVVVFRGTDDPGDWLANLDRFVAKTPDGPAHRGFYTAYSTLGLQAKEVLRKSEVKSAWVTGHSLGGALAVLCAYELARDETIDIAGCMTFGQPMVARPPLTNRIEELLSSRYVHFANNRDIVTRVEPSFKHCGSLVYYDGQIVRRSKPKLLMASASGDEESLDEDPGFEIEPLPAQEFRALQKELREEKAEPDFAPDGTPLMNGNSPFIRDHDMDLYLDRVRSTSPER